MVAKQRKTSDKNRKFKGVWIPAKYWLDDNLSINEVALITEIDSLDGNDGCWASNNHFANFLGVTRGRASQLIKDLKEKGYISIDYKTVDNVTQRKIRVVNKLNTPVRKLKGGIKNSKGVFRKCVTSNTRSNTNKSNTFSSLSSSLPHNSNSYKQEEEKSKEIKNKLLIQIKKAAQLNDSFNGKATKPLQAEWDNILSLSKKLTWQDLNWVVTVFDEQMKSDSFIEKPYPYVLTIMREKLKETENCQKE